MKSLISIINFYSFPAYRILSFIFYQSRTRPTTSITFGSHLSKIAVNEANPPERSVNAFCNETREIIYQNTIKKLEDHNFRLAMQRYSLPYSTICSRAIDNSKSHFPFNRCSEMVTLGNALYPIGTILDCSREVTNGADIEIQQMQR